MINYGFENGTCNMCEIGTFSNGTVPCESCNVTNCDVCTEINNCTQCAINYTVDGGQCVAACQDVPNCLICSEPTVCSECNVTYTLLNGTCLACNITDCITCSANNVCNNCSNSLSPSTNGSSCVTCNNITNCLTCSDNNYCGQCSQPYVAINGSCVLCGVL